MQNETQSNKSGDISGNSKIEDAAITDSRVAENEQLRRENAWLTKALAEANVELASWRCSTMPNYIAPQN
jgi:hypothetical protein